MLTSHMGTGSVCAIESQKVELMLCQSSPVSHYGCCAACRFVLPARSMRRRASRRSRIVSRVWLVDIAQPGRVPSFCVQLARTMAQRANRRHRLVCRVRVATCVLRPAPRLQPCARSVPIAWAWGYRRTRPCRVWRARTVRSWCKVPAPACCARWAARLVPAPPYRPRLVCRVPRVGIVGRMCRCRHHARPDRRVRRVLSLPCRAAFRC
jgi:hypothetical protein